MRPVKYKNLFDSKTHNAHLIEFDNQKDYVVKMHKKDANKTLANEWIGYHLARYMGLPIPETVVIEIPAQFITDNPPLTNNVILTKRQLATPYIENSYNAHEIDVKEITNKDSLAAIIVLDYWLANVDRTRKNILFTKEEKNKHHLWVIDYGDSFQSFNWEKRDLDNLPQEIMESATHQMLASYIENENEYWEQLSKINAIPMLLLEEIIEIMPEEWGISSKEKQKLIETLVERRDKILPRVIKQFIKQSHRPRKK